MKERNYAIWLGTVGSFLLRFLLNVFIARFAGADQMGIFVATAAFAFVIGRITDFGLPNSIAYFVRIDRDSAANYSSICFIHSIATMPLSWLIFFIAVHSGAASADTTDFIKINILTLAILANVQTYNSVLGQILISINRSRAFALATTFGPALSICGCFYYGTELDATKLVHISLISESVAATLTTLWIWFRATAGWASRPLPSIKTLYTYSLKTHAGTSAKAISQRADKIVLSWFVPNSLVAAYSVAVSLRDSSLIPANTHSMILRNRLIDRYKDSDAAVGTASYIKAELVRWLAISTILTLTLGSLAPFIVHKLYGPEFQSASSVLMLLALTLPPLVVSLICWTVLLSKGKAGVVSYGLIAGGVANILAIYVGASIDGVFGACVGSLISALLLSLVWLAAAFKK